jgi:hypothetical protein
MNTIIDLSYFSVGFPNKTWKDLIKRGNYSESIISILEEGENILFLSGNSGIGKTTLLAQFCRKNSSNSISVFFNQFHNLDLTIDYLRLNITSQINFILNPKNTHSTEEYVSAEQYRRSLMNLKKKFKNSKNVVYIIIDGLENRDNNYDDVLKNIYQELPIGEDHIKFIITGTVDEYSKKFNENRSLKIKELPMLGFDTHQVKAFLGDLFELAENHQSILKVTKNYPARLEVLKRLLIKGIKIDEIVNSENYRSWLELDTENIELDNPLNGLILSLICLNAKDFTIHELSKIIGQDKLLVESKVKELHILELKGEIVQFVSKDYSDYYVNILRANRRKCSELLIKYYASSEKLNDKFELSKLYVSQQKWSKIIEIIDAKFLADTVQSTGSIDMVNQSIEMGLTSSEELKSYDKIFQYAIEGSIVNELDNYLFWESEIMAKISLNDFAGAINLAEKAVLKVDRLRLLSLVAKKEKQINNKVDEELISLIKELYETTNLVGIGDVIFDIVSNLIYAVPNLAIEIIEKTSGDVNKSNINDWIVAKLSIAAINSNKEDKQDSSEKEDKLKALEKLNNPSVRKIQRSISLMVGNYTSSKVLEEVKKLQDSKEKLKLLRLWLKNNRSLYSGIDKVIEVTFEELIKSTSDSNETLDTLIDLSYQLSRVKKLSQKEAFLKKFQSFERNIIGSGLGKDYYTYKLNLFEAQLRLKFDRAEHEVSIIINKINRIDDNLIKLESYCQVFYKLTLINDRRFTTYYNKVYGRIKREVKTLLNSSANHFKITENVISTIGKVNPVFALEIVELINLSTSRDRARLTLLDAYLDKSIKHISRDNLHLIINSFDNDLPQEVGIQSILERFTNTKSLPFPVIKELLPFTQKISSFKRSERKLECSILSLELASKNTVWSERLSESYKQMIKTNWSQIEADWDKIDSGFTIASDVSKIDRDFAKEIFDESVEMKKQNWLDSKAVATSYITSLRLVLKAYVALIKNHENKSQDLTLFTEIINRIPSEIERLKLWTELSINILLTENTALLKTIYNKHISPLVTSIIKNKRDIDRIIESFIVVHYLNPELAVELIEKLSIFNKEAAYVRISDFYIEKRNPFENYEGELLFNKPVYDDIFKSVNLLKGLQTDYLIYGQICVIATAIKNGSISIQQKIEIKGKIAEIIAKKLPDQSNIKHEGYLILCEIILQTIDKDAKVSWNSFLERAEEINNVSDRLFIKAQFLKYLPSPQSKNKTITQSIIQKIFEDVQNLTSHYEYVERVVELSKVMYQYEKSRWQVLVNKAFNLSCDFENGIEKYDYQRTILDSMYRIDEDFAKTLIVKNSTSTENSGFDKKLLKDHYNNLELAKKIKNNKNVNELKVEGNRHIINAIYSAQGSLNSGKLITKKISDVAQYLKVGKNVPLTYSYPVYSYFLLNSSNLRLTKGQKSEISLMQRRIFDSLLKGIKLIEVLSQKRKFENSSSNQLLIDQDFSENLVVRPNTREEAVNYIRDWIIDEAEEFIVITDPYLQPKDIEIIKFIKEKDNDIEIIFLGCNDKPSSELQIEFENNWKKISDESIPFARFVFCWIPEEKSKKPIHDRWILSKNSGLRIGTSYGSLGSGRESEISLIKTNEAYNLLETTIRGYLEMKTRSLNNQKIKYSSFTF